MGRSPRYIALAALLFALPGCKKGAGDLCYKAGDCEDGLACAGRAPRRCTPCAETEECKNAGKCDLIDGRCVGGTRDLPDNKEGGCPCGCDRSVAMAAEVEELGGEAALGALSRALETIGEREEAGYVTEAMVQHRLRLRELEASLRPAPEAAAPRAIDGRATTRRALPAAERHGLRARAELVVHGETAETVRGREKLLRASFRVWMELENRTGDRLVLDAPAIEGNVPLPVSRWYVESGDGQPWDGILPPGQTRTVLVIGYLGEPVPPGTPLAATIRVGSLEIPVNARARARWNRDD